MDQETSNDTKSGKYQKPSVWHRLKRGLLNVYYFCQLNGTYIALYGLMLPSILMNVLSAVFNE